MDNIEVVKKAAIFDPARRLLAGRGLYSAAIGKFSRASRVRGRSTYLTLCAAKNSYFKAASKE